MSSPFEVKVAKSDNEIEKCFLVLKELRPHLQASTFQQTVREMIAEGYMLAYIEEHDTAVAAVGFRYLQFLYNGKHFYIDDLSTLPDYRAKGYAGALLEFVFERARENGYKVVTLDSGYLRFDAHRLYLNKGFTINCHHFSKSIE